MILAIILAFVMGLAAGAILAIVMIGTLIKETNATHPKDTD